MIEFLKEKGRLLNENSLLKARIQLMKVEKIDEVDEKKGQGHTTKFIGFMTKFREFEKRINEMETEKIKALKDRDMWYNKSMVLEKEFL